MSRQLRIRVALSPWMKSRTNWIGGCGEQKNLLLLRESKLISTAVCPVA
jgi:hypothetical protein